MNEKLQQAIAATRNGQVQEAQILLTQVLKDDPNEAQAWFLLSNLVDSEQKKIAYLGKVLALNPEHEMAQKMLLRLRGADVSAEETAVAEQEEESELATAVGSENAALEAIDLEDDSLIADLADADILAAEEDLPDWLVEEELADWESDISDEVEVSDAAEIGVKTDTIQESVVPEWLQEEAEEAEITAEQLAAVESGIPTPVEDEPASIKSVRETAVAPADDHQKQHASLTRILYALVTVAVVLLIVFLYLILTAL